MKPTIFALTLALVLTAIVPGADAAPPKACNDGTDNDGDGYTDYGSDPGCSSTNDNNERGSTACDDNSDNDSDGYNNYPADAGCTGPSDSNERTDCQDSTDNDGDGVTDSSDPGCSGVQDTSERGTTACDDGADNDGDGALDYPADAECTGPSDGTEASPSSTPVPIVATGLAEGWYAEGGGCTGTLPPWCGCDAGTYAVSGAINPSTGAADFRAEVVIPDWLDDGFRPTCNLSGTFPAGTCSVDTAGWATCANAALGTITLEPSGAFAWTKSASYPKWELTGALVRT